MPRARPLSNAAKTPLKCKGSGAPGQDSNLPALQALSAPEGSQKGLQRAHGDAGRHAPQ